MSTQICYTIHVALFYLVSQCIYLKVRPTEKHIGETFDEANA